MKCPVEKQKLWNTNCMMSLSNEAASFYILMTLDDSRELVSLWNNVLNMQGLVQYRQNVHEKINERSNF